MIRQSLDPINSGNMSDAIPTIPNFCSYKTFRQGFGEGLGVCCEPVSQCVNKTVPSTIRLRYWGKLHSVQATCCLDVNNNNTSWLLKTKQIPASCDWFDAYSVTFDPCYTSTPTQDSYEVDDHYQDIEDDLNARITAVVSRSDSGLSGCRASTARVRRRNRVPLDSNGQYSKKKGCIDWLETCDSNLHRADSHTDLIRSYEEQFKYQRLGLQKVSRNGDVDSDSGMFGYCTTHVERKLATDISSSEDVGALTASENYLDEEVFQEDFYYFGLPQPNGNGYLDGQGLVTIRMIPDEQGRFGFNVKGGADQGMPIIVSRVAPNTPADNAIPRLNEGDQVLFINGRDVSQHTHEQVVMFIRASRETHSGELILKVRPNAYSGEDSDEPDFVYDPETHQISSATSGANALDLSLKLLEESLESGAALAQFEQLYRKKPGMTMNAARLEANVPKNRYRDISPYDQTRVLIKDSASGDYINANYVNMEIPVSGILNRYIAAQGPLPTTCVDFWQMVWEQQSTLVVMLTTKVERGRIKCHQYWPDLYETSDYGHLQITCVKEEETPSFAFREFNLTHVEAQEERHISHMQYIAWPDHGVPDDPADFLDFVQKVRQRRIGLVEPVIVHCSAGIGRTGVLITMETAMCLIEANQPVYPLSIVRQMRDQRAMLIQTPNQYKFVCEAIIRCYNEGIVKPLAEYQQR